MALLSRQWGDTQMFHCRGREAGGLTQLTNIVVGHIHGVKVFVHASAEKAVLWPAQVCCHYCHGGGVMVKPDA